MATKKKTKADETFKWRGLAFERVKDAVKGPIATLLWTCEVERVSGPTEGNPFVSSYIIDIGKQTAVGEVLTGKPFEAAMYGPGGGCLASAEGTTEGAALDALLAKLHELDRVVRSVMMAEAREGAQTRSRTMFFKEVERNKKTKRGFTPPTGPAKVKVATFRRVPPPSAATIARARPPRGLGPTKVAKAKK